MSQQDACKQDGDESFQNIQQEADSSDNLSAMLKYVESARIAVIAHVADVLMQEYFRDNLAVKNAPRQESDCHE